MEIEYKICNRCKKLKPENEFHKHKQCPDGLQYTCISCRKIIDNKFKDDKKEYDKEYYIKYRRTEEVKKENKNRELKRIYNISIDQYNEIFNKQNGCCAICGIHQSRFSKKLCVDHNHSTGEVRGLLCPKCNITLGYIESKVGIVELCKIYLDTYNKLVHGS